MICGHLLHWRREREEMLWGRRWLWDDAFVRLVWCKARARWLPCLGDMQGTYVVLEPLGWHWRWGKTVLQAKCFPWSQPATVCTAQLIDKSPVDLQMLRFTHKRKGQLTKCYQLRFTCLNIRRHMPPPETGSFHHISLEEIHNHMLYMHLRLCLQLCSALCGRITELGQPELLL